MEIVETRELADDRAFMEARPPTMLYVLSEAPEGHGGLPNPRDVEADAVIVPTIDLVEREGDDIRTLAIREKMYRKERRRHGAMRKSGQLEVWEYLVWVPW